MKLTVVIAVFAANFLAWLPGCEAAMRTQAQSGLLLSRLRQKRQEPFIVSFRVSFTDGYDNAALAKNLSAEINTPGSPTAGTLGYSVARVFNGTFPPVAWPPSTTAPVMVAAPASAPQPPPGMYNPAAATTQRPTAIMTALEALRMARENKKNYDDLTKRMTVATAAHADALVFGNPSGTTPMPTAHPMMAAAAEKGAIPYTLGRLIYDAFVNTPAPLPMAVPTTGFPIQQSLTPPPVAMGGVIAQPR